MLQKIKSAKQFSNLIIYGFGQGFSLIVPLLIMPYIVGLCGIDGQGKISISLGIAYFLIVIIDYGVDIVGVKEISVNRDDAEKLKSIISTAYCARFLLLCAVLVLASVVFFTIPFFYKEKTLFFLCLPILIGQFINPTWVYQGIEHYKWIAFLNIFSKVIYATGIFIFIRVPGDYIYANMWWGIGGITANAIAFLYLRKKYRLSFNDTDKHKIREYLKANFSFFFSQLFVSAQFYLPIILIGFISNDSVAGKYSIVDRVINMFKTYLTVFFSFVYPRVCYLAEENVKEGMRFWKRYNGLNLTAIVFGILVMFYFAEPIISYFKANEVTEIAGYLRFGLIVPLLLAISMPLKQLLLGFGRQKLYIRLTMILVLFNGLLLAILLYFYGVYGVLASLIITEVITAGVYAYNIKDKLFRTVNG